MDGEKRLLIVEGLVVNDGLSVLSLLIIRSILNIRIGGDRHHALGAVTLDVVYLDADVVRRAGLESEDAVAHAHRHPRPFGPRQGACQQVGLACAGKERVVEQGVHYSTAVDGHGLGGVEEEERAVEVDFHTVGTVLGGGAFGGVGGVDAEMEGTADADGVVLAHLIAFTPFRVDAQAADDGLDVVGVGEAEMQWVNGGGVGVQVGRAAAPYLEVQVRPAAAAGVAAVGHQLPLLDGQFVGAE